MAQDNNDAQEAYKAYQAYKAYKSQQAPQGQPSPTPQAAPQQSYMRLPQDTGYTPGGQPASVAEADPEGNARNAKIGATLALGPVASAESLGLGLLGKASVNAGTAGLGTYLANLIDQKQDRTDGVPFSAALGGLISAGADASSSLLKGAANSSMIRAVGLTPGQAKYAPRDIGNRIVDEGLWGSKAAMAKQVASKYADSEQQIQDLASELDGKVGGDTLSQAIQEKAKQYLNPEDASKIVSGREGGVDAFSRISKAIREGAAGYAPEVSTPAVSTNTGILDASGSPIVNEIPAQFTPAQEGTYGGRGLLALKRAGDAEAFNQSGAMGNSYAADAYRAQADASRQALGDISEGAMPDALRREQTLLYANKGLMKPTTVYKNPVSLTDIGSAMVGSSSGGLPGAGGAVLASKAVTSPLIQSLFAHGAQASSTAASTLSDPVVLQALFGVANASSTK